MNRREVVEKLSELFIKEKFPNRIHSWLQLIADAHAKQQSEIAFVNSLRPENKTETDKQLQEFKRSFIKFQSSYSKLKPSLQARVIIEYNELIKQSSLPKLNGFIDSTSDLMCLFDLVDISIDRTIKSQESKRLSKKHLNKPTIIFDKIFELYNSEPEPPFPIKSEYEGLTLFSFCEKVFQHLNYRHLNIPAMYKKLNSQQIL